MGMLLGNKQMGGSEATPVLPISFKEAGSFVYMNTSSIPVPYVANPVAGDLLVMVIRSRSQSTYTLGVGWFELESKNSSDTSYIVATKIATGSESGNETVTISSSRDTVGVMFSIENYPDIAPLFSTSYFTTNNSIIVNHIFNVNDPMYVAIFINSNLYSWTNMSAGFYETLINNLSYDIMVLGLEGATSPPPPTEGMIDVSFLTLDAIAITIPKTF